MKKKISYLIMFLIISIFFIGIKDVSATCYKWTSADGGSNTYLKDPENLDSWKTNGNKIEEVEDSFCENNSDNYKSSILEINKISEFVDSKSACKNNGYVWNKVGNIEEAGYCNVDNLQYVMCGDAHDIPAQIPALISMAVNLLKIATPIVLIIVSIITLVKATMASKEDEIKKAQQSLTRKVIAAVMIFVIISVVQFVILKVADNKDQNSISSCMSCFLNNDCSNNKYFKYNYGGIEYCSLVDDYSKIVGDKHQYICEEFYNENKVESKEIQFNCSFDYITKDPINNEISGTYIVTFNMNGNAIKVIENRTIKTPNNKFDYFTQEITNYEINLRPTSELECYMSKVDIYFDNKQYLHITKKN